LYAKRKILKGGTVGVSTPWAKEKQKPTSTRTRTRYDCCHLCDLQSWIPIPIPITMMLS